MKYTLLATHMFSLEGDGKLRLYPEPTESAVEIAVAFTVLAITHAPVQNGWISKLVAKVRYGQGSPITPADKLELRRHAERGKILIDEWRGRKIGLALTVASDQLAIDLLRWSERHEAPGKTRARISEQAFDDLTEVLKMTEEVTRTMSIST